MPSSHQEIRRPEFLERALGKSGVEPAHFLGSVERSAPKLRAVPASSPAESMPQPSAHPIAPPAPVVAIAEVEERVRAEFGERIGAAIEVLKAHGERMAAEARVDALEIAFIIARKIIDTEIAASFEPLVGMIRTAVRRLGESRRIVVHLCPRDAEALERAAAERGASPLSGITSAQLEVVADASLERGDCVIDGDFSTIDGRLSGRIEELRRAVLAAQTEGGE